MHYILYHSDLPELPKINPSDEIVLFCKEDHFSIADVTKLLEFSSKQITLTPASSPEQTLLNVGILIGQTKDIKFLGDLKIEVEALLGESMPKQQKARARKAPTRKTSTKKPTESGLPVSANDDRASSKEDTVSKNDDNVIENENVSENKEDSVAKKSRAKKKPKIKRELLRLPDIPHEEFGRKGEGEKDIRHALCGCFRYESDMGKVRQNFNKMFPNASEVAKKYMEDNQEILFTITNDII